MPSDERLAQEFAELEKIKVTEGVEYDILSKRNAEWIERKFESPTTLYDEPVPFKFWQGVRDLIEGLIARTMALDLRASRDKARKFAHILYKNEVNALSPMLAQMEFHDMLVLVSPTDDADPNALRCFREACYVFFNREYLGRQIG